MPRARGRRSRKRGCGCEDAPPAPAMPELKPGVDKPRRWQYVAGVIIILCFALLLYSLRSSGY